MEAIKSSAALLEISDGLRWYAIRTKPKKESSVEKRFKDLNLDVFLPWMRTRRRIGTRYQWVLAPLFPGYLFCRLDMMLSGKTARYAPGVRDFVKFGSRIPDITDSIIEGLKQRCPDGIAAVGFRPYRNGEPVLIKEGPLAGLGAVFECEMKAQERVAVFLDFLGRQTRIVLPFEVIDRN